MALLEPRLLLITDRNQARRPLADVVAAALQGGCRWISVREKDLDAAEQVALARGIVEAARPFGARVLVHGEARLALEARCAGVHLPAGSAVEAARALLGGAWVSISCHHLEEVLAAAEAGADAVSLSPILPSASKPGYGPALGLARLAEIAAAVPLPVIALGGIEHEADVRACLQAGAAAVAVMGAVMRADDPAALVTRLVRAVTHPTAAPRGNKRAREGP